MRDRTSLVGPTFGVVGCLAFIASLYFPAQPAVSQMQSKDPVLGFHYLVECEGGVLTGLFTEAGNIGSEHEVIEHDVVDENGIPFTMKIPGRLKFTDITLKRGITNTMDAWAWRAKIEAGEVEFNRFGCSITMLDHDLNPVVQWNIERAWPSKIAGPSFGGHAISLESITLVHEGYERVPVAVAQSRMLLPSIEVAASADTN